MKIQSQIADSVRDPSQKNISKTKARAVVKLVNFTLEHLACIAHWVVHQPAIMIQCNRGSEYRKGRESFILDFELNCKDALKKRSNDFNVLKNADLLGCLMPLF